MALKQGVPGLGEGHMQPEQMLPSGSPQRCPCLPLLPTSCQPAPVPSPSAPECCCAFDLSQSDG